MADILIVDDDRDVRDGYSELLLSEGYTVRTARNGDVALQCFEEHIPDLVLLDINMPRLNGHSVCEKMRERDCLVPIIFLTANPSDINHIRALNAGGNGFLSKDISEDVLVANIASTLARCRAFKNDNKSKKQTITIGRIVIDLEDFAVRDGEKVIAHLTKTEIALLRVLSSDRGRLFSFDDLTKEIYGENYVVTPEAYRTNFGRLRKKLGDASASIINEHSRGYYLVK